MSREPRQPSSVVRSFEGRVVAVLALLALAAALVDVVAGDLSGTRALVVVLVPVAAVTAVGHLLAILTSSRLR